MDKLYVYTLMEKGTGSYVSRKYGVFRKVATPRLFHRVCDAKQSAYPWKNNKDKYVIVRLTVSNPETVFAPPSIEKWCNENGYELKKKEF